MSSTMASLTVRNLDDEDKRGLRIRAASHGISMEEEARRIIRRALREEESANGEEAKRQWERNQMIKGPGIPPKKKRKKTKKEEEENKKKAKKKWRTS